MDEEWLISALPRSDMSYDPYNDPMNPVSKGNTSGRTIKIRPAEDGVAGGYTEAQPIFTNWNRESGDDNDLDDTPSP